MTVNSGTERSGGTAAGNDQRATGGAGTGAGSAADGVGDSAAGDRPVARTDGGRSTGGSAFGVATTDDDWRVRAAAPPSDVLDALFEAVATATGRDPAELVPLYESVDPDGLRRLFEHDPSAIGAVEASFSYAGCDVRVERLGTEVRVTVDADPVAARRT